MKFHLGLGSSIKVPTLRFNNFRPQLLHTVLSYTSLPLVLAFFCELPSIKEPQTTLQNKENTVQSYRKCWFKRPRKALGSRLRFLTEWGRWEWILSAVFLSLLYIYFVTNLWKKKLWRTYACSWTSPYPNKSQYAFS